MTFRFSLLTVFVFALLQICQAGGAEAQTAKPQPRTRVVVQPANVPIDEFHQVTTAIWRGARPEFEGLQALRDMGIRTDLNLDNDEVANEDEARSADVLKLKYIPRPLSGFFAPSDEQIDEILSILSNPANYPIYVHCAHGQDRTGLAVGLFRVEKQGWKPEQAYDEMLRYNFHPELFLLNSYFKNRTGWGD